MEPTYEKDGIYLKITTPTVQRVTLTTLNAEKEQIEEDRAGLTAQYESNMAASDERMRQVDERIAKATEFGVDITAIDE